VENAVSPQEKSAGVVIAGQPEGMHRAAVEVMDFQTLLPILIWFMKYKRFTTDYTEGKRITPNLNIKS
jgi:hypothetical protein